MAEGARPAALGLLEIRLRRIGDAALAFLKIAVGPLLAAALGLVASLIYVQSPDVARPIFDDAYISLHFARNLAEHAKLTYDGVSWSTGATSPFHVAVLALPIKLGADPIATGIAAGVVAHALLAVAVYCLALAVFRSAIAGLLAALAIAFNSYAALDSGNGLETSLFMALVAASMAAFLVAQKPVTKLGAGGLVALAVLTRPEGAFLLPAIVVYRWLERARGEPLRLFVEDAVLVCVPGFAALAAVAGLSLWVNGSLGGTASAKLRFFQEDGGSLKEKLDIGFEHISYFLAPLITLLALAAVAARRRETTLFVLFWLPALLFHILLFPGGLTHYFSRYQHPMLPLLAVLAGGGAAYLITEAMRRDIVAKALVAAGLLIVAFPLWLAYDDFRGQYELASHETQTNLEAMVLDLNQIVQPQEVVATHDIGAVAYFGDFVVLDLVGLVNPDVIPFHEGRRVKEYVQAVEPDYLLFFPEWDLYFLHIFPDADPERYELVKVYEGGQMRIAPYHLYRVRYP